MSYLFIFLCCLFCKKPAEIGTRCLPLFCMTLFLIPAFVMAYCVHDCYFLLIYCVVLHNKFLSYSSFSQMFLSHLKGYDF